jgi:DNA end-binding protein Ku
MAPRPFWQGYLKLSLVTCPVAMTPAITTSEKVRFHVLNQATRNRVVSRYVDADTGKEVDNETQVKGYETANDKFIQLEDEELDAVALESTRTIDIDKFVPSGEIDPIWLDRAHYLVPNDEVGEEAFAVIREAMAVTKTHGIARLVLYRRERAVLLEPRDKGLILWTLRFGDEVRDVDAYFDRIKKVEVKKDALALAEKVIEERTKPWAKTMTTDRMQKALLKTIADKRKGGKRRAVPQLKRKPDTGEAANVVNIMDALKKSLANESRRPRR